MLLVRSAVILAFGCVAVSSTLAKAQSTGEPLLTLRVDSLERRVNELERRLAALESPTRTDTGRNQPSTGNPRDIANWRRLRAGMSYDDVREILGEPTRINGGGVAFWSYPRGGQVSFVSGRVSSWQEPER